MTDRMSIWNSLCKTDPKHTKPFKRAGGFSGTAIRPMWAIQRMTEEFGPAGEGWGVGEPRFQVEHVAGGDEVLVFCTVSVWHGDPANTVYGVGGDKCFTTRKSGDGFADDEAFKKSFTDAITNALKLIGVGADVHMGQFDDSKYVNQMEKKFAEPKPPYPDGRFTENLPKWQQAIADGKATADQIISRAEQTGTLTDAQKRQIRGE